MSRTRVVRDSLRMKLGREFLCVIEVGSNPAIRPTNKEKE